MKAVIKKMFGSLDEWGRFWLWLGFASLAAAASMSFAVGWKMTALHAVFLACLSFVTAFLPMAAEQFWTKGRKGVALILAVLCAPLLMVEFGQHAAYTAGIRGHDLATTKVQNVKYDNAQEEVDEARRTIAMFENRLRELEKQNGWAASATADSMRARLPALELAISQEAARGGCKAQCLARTKERDELAERIKTLEAKADYTKNIEAAKIVIARAREKANTVEHKSSQTEHMNAFLSKAVALVGKGSLTPDAYTEEGTQLSANLAMALAGTGLPALAFFVAGLYRRKEDEHEAPKAKAPTVTTAQPSTRLIGVGKAVFPV